MPHYHFINKDHKVTSLESRLLGRLKLHIVHEVDCSVIQEHCETENEPLSYVGVFPNGRHALHHAKNNNPGRKFRLCKLCNEEVGEEKIK